MQKLEHSHHLLATESSCPCPSRENWFRFVRCRRRPLSTWRLAISNSSESQLSLKELIVTIISPVESFTYSQKVYSPAILLGPLLLGRLVEADVAHGDARDQVKQRGAAGAAGAVLAFAAAFGFGLTDGLRSSFAPMDAENTRA